MIKVRDEKDQINIAKVYRAGQEHIFRFWDDLGPKERRALLDQVDGIDLQLLAQLARTLGDKPRLRRLEPPPELLPIATGTPSGPDARAFEAGEEALRRGQVAGIIVAGGQGTRLGFDGPKGAFPIGPVSKRSLFRIFAEKALGAARRYRSSFPLYVMTSAQNHAAVVEQWKAHQHYSMSAADVMFFPQREIACLDLRGKLILEAPGRLAMSPNGHGGLIDALQTSGALADMERRGVELLSYWQVDNPLVRVADPLFLGDLIVRNADAGAKVAQKRSPDERVGVWASIDGKLGVVEYTELSPEQQSATDEGGRLLFGAGNLAIHAFRRGFLERVAQDPESLTYHQALKKVPYVDRDGAPQDPPEPNAIKFEMFVFDAFRDAQHVVLREVDRAREFSPVKNADGEDSAATSRQALSDLYASWLEQNGVEVPRDEGGRAAVAIEISPLVAEGPEDLARRVELGLRVDGPLLLEA